MKEKMWMVLRLSVPAILAEISSIVMQYIDAGMVGSLGADASASIGLVASTTWLINGIGMAVAAGFAVQVAQFVGARQPRQARDTMRQAMGICALIALGLSGTAVSLSGALPRWLGAARRCASWRPSIFLCTRARCFLCSTGRWRPICFSARAI